MNRVIQYHWLPAKSFTQGRKRPITAIVLHSTDGFLAGDIATLTGPKVSVHWLVARDGTVYHFVQNSDTAYHAGVVTSSKYSNAGTIGIEQTHRDGYDDWPAVQIQRTAEIVAALRQTYGDIPAKSHAEVASPKGRKSDPVVYPWEFFSQKVKEALTDTWTFQKI